MSFEDETASSTAPKGTPTEMDRRTFEAPAAERSWHGNEGRGSDGSDGSEGGDRGSSGGPAMRVSLMGGMLLGLPVLLCPYPPMTDFPFHEVVVGLLRHRGEELFDIPGLYQGNWGHPNQLFYLLGWVLSFGMPVLWACKTVVFASIAAIPPATERFRRFFDAPATMTWVACTFAYSYVFYWGLAPNLLAFPLFLAAIPSLVSQGLFPSRRTAGATLAWLALLYFGHEAMFVAGLLVVGAVSLLPTVRGDTSAGTRARFRAHLGDFAAKIWPGALAAVLVLARHGGASQRTMGTYVGSPTIFESGMQRLLGMPLVLVGPHGWWAALALSAIVLGTVAVQALGVRRMGPLMRRRRHGAWAAGGVLLLAYVLAPTAILGTHRIHQRFLVPSVLFLAAAGAAGVRPRGQRMASWLACTGVAGSLLLALPEFLLANDSFQALLRLRPRMAQGSAMISLGLMRQDAHASAAYGQYCHLVVEDGGRTAYDISSSPISPVLRRPERAWTEAYQRSLDPETFSVEATFRTFRYLLAWFDDPRLEEVFSASLQPHARLVAVEGNWLLYEATGPVVSLDALDAELPRPSGDTLALRLRRVLEAVPDGLQRPLAKRFGLANGNRKATVNHEP